jgi:extracellular factor (EF) 3-hydroxypalmitic acid methyl ester biosynthesis protein
MPTQNGNSNWAYSVNGESSAALVLGQTSQGAEIHASLSRLTRYTAVFEIYNPAVVLRTSEVLEKFKVLINETAVYSGRATVRSVINAGVALLCEVSLGDSWVAMDVLPVGRQKQVANFSEFLRQWQKMYNIRPEFKIAVADMQTFLTDMRLWFEQVELNVRSMPSGSRLSAERDIAAELGQSTTPALTALFEKFEHALTGLDLDLEPAHQSFSRRQLHPALLCAPFLYRAYFKPLGYAGDYEMVNMIARDPLEGGSLFAKILNLWFLQQAPAEAHRNRIKYLTGQLSQEILRSLKTGRPLRILSVGCGPAQEVQCFLKENPLAKNSDFTLLDFNSETLAHVESVLTELKRRLGLTTPIKCIKKSVHHILKESGKSVERTADDLYDLVYCAGLFDYLTDSVCRKLTGIFYEWLAPGGLLVTTNVDALNPRRITMDYIMEWHLNYRNSAEFSSLRPDRIPAEACKLKSDETGVNIYFEARKPSA